MNNFTDTDISILTCLLKWHISQDNDFSLTKGCKIEFITENITTKSVSRIRQALKSLMEEEMVIEGIKHGLKKTYILTPKGISCLKSLKNNTINVMDK